MTRMQKSQDSPAARSEFWGICCESGKKYSQVVKKKFHLSMAALDPTVSTTSDCVSLMVERGGCQYLLCNLKSDTILQVNLNLFFDIGEKVTFSLKGQGTVHLSGYHIFQDGNQSLTKDSYRSLDNSLNSDIDIDDEETDSSEEQFEDSSDDEDEDEEEFVLSPKKNSALRKVDATARKANATPTKKAQTPKISPNKKDALSKIEVKAAALKTILRDSKAFNKLVSKRTLEKYSSDDDGYSEESDDSSDDGNAKPKQKSKDLQTNKRLKIDSSTPAQGKKMGNRNTPKSAEVIDLEDDTPKSVQKSINKGDLDSSIGRTPMPKKAKAAIFNSIFNSTPGNKSLKNKSLVEDESSDDNSDEMDVSVDKSSAEQLNASAQGTESKKKRKKKKKAAANNSQENTPNKLNESLPAFKSAKKLPGGLEYEDIRVGQGLEAKKGKLVHVFYTGKLENNKVFDSRQPGSKPFSFKLGSGQVIKGWDVGLEGMKVGGKRKLKIPPHMAYKNQRMGDIPPSSTLHFIVELKAVS